MTHHPCIKVEEFSVGVPIAHCVVVHLSAQTAADVLAAMYQAIHDSTDADLDMSDYRELVRQLKLLTRLPEPSRVG